MYKNKTTARCVGLYASISLAYSTRIRWIMDHGSKVTAALSWIQVREQSTRQREVHRLMTTDAFCRPSTFD